MNPESFLILFNISKESSLGFLIRTANVFGAKVIVVGKRHFSRGGATGRAQSTSLRRFYELSEAVDFVRERGCRLIGVEINKSATSIMEAEFSGPTAFMVGNEGEGLSEKQLGMCDELVFIPQYGNVDSANINVATGIVLHHYAHQVGYRQCDVAGGKFVEPIESPE